MKKIYCIALLLISAVSLQSYSQALTPPSLKCGDTIALISPSRAASQEKVDALAESLKEYGFTLITAPNAMESSEGYAGTPAQRVADIKWALTNPSVKAIIASRGGYGAVQLLDSLNIIDHIAPKWMIGFSDFTVIHAWLESKGIKSIHGPMANTYRKNSVPARSLNAILTGHYEALSLGCDSLNHPGTAKGIVRGGNLAVLADLLATPYDMVKPGTILFIEDVEEPIYKVERIIWQLKFSGKLDNLAGLIIGQFTQYDAEKQYSRMEDMIARMLKDYHYPIVFNAPIGHVSWNTPIIEGAPATLTVNPSGRAHLIYQIP